MHYVSIKILEIPLLLVFLGEVDTYRGSDSAAKRINFYKGPPCNIEKKYNFLETLYIDGISSPDHVHDVSIKILEIPLLLVFLGEVDTYCGSDSAAIRINFYKGPPL